MAEAVCRVSRFDGYDGYANVGTWAWDDSDLVDNPAPRCLCSHSLHPRGQCWSAACGCQKSREKDPK